MPIIGNHEYYDGDNAYRWLNQTDFVPLIDDHSKSTDSARRTGSKGSSHVRISAGGRSTATRAIGHALAPSLWLATAARSNTAGEGASAPASASAGDPSPPSPPPSNTSRFFSVDIGLGHFIALDGNVYINKLDKKWAEAQLEWLEADLNAVNRSKTPWVIAMSHFPLHISSEFETVPMTWYNTYPIISHRLLVL